MRPGESEHTRHRSRQPAGRRVAWVGRKPTHGRNRSVDREVDRSSRSSIRSKGQAKPGHAGERASSGGGAGVRCRSAARLLTATGWRAHAPSKASHAPQSIGRPTHPSHIHTIASQRQEHPIPFKRGGAAVRPFGGEASKQPKHARRASNPVTASPAAGISSSCPSQAPSHMLPRTGAVAAAAMVGCAQCGLKRARAAGAAALSSSPPPSSLPWAASGQRSAGFSTAAKKDGKKKGKGGGGGEEGGGDASKNAWYIKMLDTAPGKGCVCWFWCTGYGMVGVSFWGGGGGGRRHRVPYHIITHTPNPNPKNKTGPRRCPRTCRPSSRR